jgi:hypothetical protein
MSNDQLMTKLREFISSEAVVNLSEVDGSIIIIKSMVNEILYDNRLTRTEIDNILSKFENQIDEQTAEVFKQKVMNLPEMWRGLYNQFVKVEDRSPQESSYRIKRVLESQYRERQWRYLVEIEGLLTPIWLKPEFVPNIMLQEFEVRCIREVFQNLLTRSGAIRSGLARDERIQDFNRIIMSRIDIDELAEEKMKTL